MLVPTKTPMAYQEKQLQEISKQFQIYGEILHAETFKIGHINETYSATYNQGGMRVRYIHQKINKSVFKNPASVMNNVLRFFFQAEDGIRDHCVTGVQTCALPISTPRSAAAKQTGLKVCYFVAPQIWASRPWRIKKVQGVVDVLCCMLPFEEEYFRERGVKAVDRKSVV